MFMIHWAKVLWVSDIRIYFCKMAGILGIRTKHIPSAATSQPAGFTSPEPITWMDGDLCRWTWVPTKFCKHPSIFPAKSTPHKNWPQLGWWKDTTCCTILQNNQVLILWKLVNSHVFRLFLLYMPTEKLDLLQIHRSINTE